MKTATRVWARMLSVATTAGAVLLAPAASADGPAAAAPRISVAAPERPFAQAAGFGAAWSAAVDSALSAVKGLSVVQRFVAQRLAPQVTGAPAALAAAPAALAVEKPSTPRFGPVTFGPVTVDRSALSAIEPRPFEAVLLGARVPLPWDVP